MKSISKSLKNKKSFLMLATIILISIILLVITGKLIMWKKPFKIGLVCTLTGPPSTQQIDLRDAVILAVEKVNKSGGINRQKIELIIKNDKLDVDEALRVDRELINEGAKIIIGHMFSTLTLKAVPLMNENNVLMISPASMTEKLTGIDDNLIRLGIPLDRDALLISKIIRDRFHLKRMAVAYDLINQALSEPSFNYFKKGFEENGGKISANIPFNSKNDFSARDISKKIISSGADGVYIISDAIHSALICQHLRIRNSKIKIMVHSWAFGDPFFIREGGNTVEKVLGIKYFLSDNNNKEFSTFQKEYFNRFNREATGSAQVAHSLMQIIFYALSKTDNPKKIKETILQKRVFNVISGKIIIDKYGDPLHDIFLTEIQNGTPVIIDSIEAESLLKDYE